MADSLQISTHVSASTKDRLDRFARAYGLTRAALIEQAVLHHLHALEALPTDMVVPTRIVLDAAAAGHVAELIERPPEPTADMRELFDDR